MAKVLMIQGTMSNAGKSLLVTGLCRILKEDGIKAAPFKSQNMALNSYITSEGLEMGRAQVVQAEAAGIPPSVRMNPILLKPNSDTGSQVIVNGKVVDNMDARTYFQYKTSLIPKVKSAFDSLAQEYDVILIEGAGSPAEINLKSEDIVNMGMAKLVDAPVLLVGDIDRGGVFAQLYGTVELLEKEEQNRIKGLIINKFRGDVSILEPGIQMLEEKVHKKVIATIPYMQVDIEEEDSLSARFHSWEQKNADIKPQIKVSVVRFPRLSNYNDLAPFEKIPEVQVRYVKAPHEIEHSDIIILPGSKNTTSDLLWMRSNGLESIIQREAGRGTLILGICGGFQMLGHRLFDPEHTEGKNLELCGIGLLPVETTYTTEKVRTQRTGILGQVTGAYSHLSNSEYQGYEIHMGQTTLEKDHENIQVLDAEDKNLITICKENILGTYLHGFLDKKDMVMGILSAIEEKKGISLTDTQYEDFADYKEQQYKKLAEEMRKHLDMDFIYQMLEEGNEYDGTI